MRSRFSRTYKPDPGTKSGQAPGPATRGPVGRYAPPTAIAIAGRCCVHAGLCNKQPCHLTELWTQAQKHNTQHTTPTRPFPIKITEGPSTPRSRSTRCVRRRTTREARHCTALEHRKRSSSRAWTPCSPSTRSYFSYPKTSPRGACGAQRHRRSHYFST